MTFAEKCEEFCEFMRRKGMDEEDLRATLLTFRAGAIALHEVMNEAADADDADVERLAYALDDEMKCLRADVMRRAVRRN